MQGPQRVQGVLEPLPAAAVVVTGAVVAPEAGAAGAAFEQGKPTMVASLAAFDGSEVQLMQCVGYCLNCFRLIWYL